MDKNNAIVILECMATNMLGQMIKMTINDSNPDALDRGIAAIDLAQEALREQVKREKGCVDCASFYESNYVFCPYCGRRLE